MNILHKFCKARQLVLYTCAGSLATAEACFQLPVYFRFAGGGKESACYQYVLLSLLQVRAKKVLRAGSDLTGGERVFEENKVFVKKIVALG